MGTWRWIGVTGLALLALLGAAGCRRAVRARPFVPHVLAAMLAGLLVRGARRLRRGLYAIVCAGLDVRRGRVRAAVQSHVSRGHVLRR